MNNHDKEPNTLQTEESKTRKPKTGLIRFAAAVAVLLLLFSIGFIGVDIIISDTDFIERQYVELGTDDEMGMTIPDLSKATTALFDYMRGRRDNIKIAVKMNGVDVDDLFYHEKEIVHMEEVRALWRGLTAFAIVGTAVAIGLLAAILFFGRHNNRIRSTGAGFLIGTLLFATIMITAAIWAISDFNSFWTVFHFIIFPDSLITYLSGGLTVETYNSLNWVFEPSFAMIRMLDELFLPLVLRASVVFGVEIIAFFLLSLLLYNRGRKLSQAGSDIVEVREIVEQERYEKVDDAPDLVLQHKLQNASLKQKMKLMEELRRDPNEPMSDIEEITISTKTNVPKDPKDAATDASTNESVEEPAELDSNGKEDAATDDSEVTIEEIRPTADTQTSLDDRLSLHAENDETTGWERPDEKEEQDGEPENDLF